MFVRLFGDYNNQSVFGIVFFIVCCVEGHLKFKRYRI